MSTQTTEEPRVRARRPPRTNPLQILSFVFIGIVVPNSILGGTFRFSKSNNEPVNPKFYIFQIQKNGSYKLVN